MKKSTGIISEYLLFLMLVAIMAVFTGCGKKGDSYDETTVIISKKGDITHRIVEVFDKDYYSEDELRNDINEELAEYCRDKDEEAAQLESLEIRDGMAAAEIVFAKPEDYAAFNEVDFFYGSVEEAIAKQYTTDVTLKGSGDDNEPIGKFEFEAMGDRMIAIVSEPVVYKVPKKIAYTTANIEIIDDMTARMASDSVGLGYIVLK